MSEGEWDARRTDSSHNLSELIRAHGPFPDHPPFFAHRHQPPPLKVRLRSQTAIGAIGAIGEDEDDAWDAPDLSLLAGPNIEAPSFPIYIFGPYWAKWCTVAALGANAPVDYTAAALLTVAAALIGNARRIAATPNWEEPPILWTVLVGVPSSGKSPALDPLSRILSAFENDMARDFDQTMRAYTAECEVAAHKKESWKTAMKAAVKAGKDAPTLPADAQEPPVPQRPRIVLGDTTMEAAAEIAAANPKGLILFRDELGGWWRGFNRYGGDGERQFWLQSYGGRPYAVDRKKLGRPVMIPRLSTTVLGGTQPDVLAALLDGEEDGFASRLFFCFPEPITGFVLADQHIDFEGARTALARLYNLSMIGGDDNDPRPLVCGLEPAAAAYFETWWAERRTEATHHAGIFGAWMGKAGGLALRLALVLEYLRWCAPAAAVSANSANSFPQQVGLSALKAAIRLIDFWAVPMARRAFGVAAISYEEADASALAGWLQRNRCERFNARDLRRSGGGPSGRLAQAGHMATACKRLVEAGLIRFVGARAGNNPGRARQDYEVNPALCR
jgi:hypothetical protein